MLKQHLISPVRINTGRGRIVLSDLTGVGKQLLREEGIEPEKTGRKGSLLHQFWMQKAKQHFERMGYGVLEEVKVGEGKSVDLVAYKGNEKIAVEIETGKSDAVGNVKKCLEAGFEKIVRAIALKVPIFQ